MNNNYVEQWLVQETKIESRRFFFNAKDLEIVLA